MGITLLTVSIHRPIVIDNVTLQTLAGLGTIATVPGDGNILQQQYSCSGSESRLQDCPAGAPVACSHTDDVTLQCANRSRFSIYSSIVLDMEPPDVGYV